MNDQLKTGWPPPALAQDDSSELSRWFASKPEARNLVRTANKEKSMTDQQQTQAANLTIHTAYGLAVNEPDPMKATEAILVKALDLHRADMAAEEKAG